jgi:hypothetical protein
MSSAWSEKKRQDGFEFSGWDPYAEPPFSSLFEWILILTTIPLVVIWLVFVNQDSSVFLCGIVPLAVYSLSWLQQRYRFIVSLRGYRLQRLWLGFTWFEQEFSPGTEIFLEEDPFEPGVTGICVGCSPFGGGISFGRGKDAESLLARIRSLADVLEVWSTPDKPQELDSGMKVGIEPSDSLRNAVKENHENH